MKSQLRALLPTRIFNALRNSLNLLQFFKTQRIQGFKIPDMPHFDPESTDFFQAQLAASQFYLEYGAGGSTILAARQGKNFISVDSDPYFLKAVNKKIGNLTNTQKLLYANIGLTGPWGEPVFQNLTPARVTQWSSYPSAPWSFLQNNNLQPDLILVDGRFRVACALTCLEHLNHSRWTLLVDDYVGRPEYQIITEFAALEKTIGRMAVFKPKPHDPKKLQAARLQYIADTA